MPQDPGLELSQLRGEFQSELLRKPSTRCLQNTEGLGLTTGPVEGPCQLPHPALTQRFLLDELLELGHELGPVAGIQPSLEPVFEGEKSPLFKPSRLVCRKWLIQHVRERRAAPQSKRRLENAHRPGRIGFESRTSLRKRFIEAIEVKLACVTVILVEEEIELEVAEMVAVPCPELVASP